MATASEKKIMAEETRAILDLCARLYAGDKVRFNKLIVWVNLENSHGVPNEIILGALQALEKQEKKGEPVQCFWPYLNAIVQRFIKEREHQWHKHGEPTRVSAILGECFRQAQEKYVRK